MRSWYGLLLVSVAIVLTGCQKSEKLSISDPQTQPSVGGGEVGNGKSPQTGESGSKGPIPGLNNGKFSDKHDPKPEDLKIDENAKGWEQATPSTSQIRHSIGRDIDDAFASLPPALVTVQMDITDKGAVLRSSPKIKIQDENRFSIQYALPETKAFVNSITADGETRALYENGKLTKLAPLGESKTREKMDRKAIEAFAMRMPMEGFSYYAYGDRPWSALVDGLQDSKNGFDTKIEEVEASPTGEERPFYRILAESKSGSSLRIELVVDSKRNVPVVFRTNYKYSDGKERMMVWRAQWQFGGNFEKKEFKIPSAGKKA